MESISIRCDAEYLLHEAPRAGEHTLLVLALHGYGSNPEAMLRLSIMAMGENCIIASLRGPNQYYVSGNPATEEIGYNWGTRKHPELNIRLHHEIVRAAGAELRGRFGIPASRTVLMGFSQPVGLNYRFIGTHPEEAGGIIAICGGVPKDWEQDKYRAVAAPILHISRSEDEFFPAETARGFPQRLRCHARDVEFHLLPGAHRFPSKARGIIEDWRARKFGAL